ncbi:GNAT family N-acetyltransferase [Natrinema ejinorense]|uniref:GNAT family N-acetyltransferase n=1 Tax=Natrinema ejinorense TaxID=373386 RepID=A0A2A5QPK1_9EURY|nr:GNAT family N-acetyltransferase [Natrinema ejinorense]PCR88781.1 GNAT family N-acetyltransferase [Natrinema ejinorense]
MTAPATSVSHDYGFHVDDETIDRTIAYRPVSLADDLGRLHAWFNAEHVQPFWDIAEPLSVVRETIAEKLATEELGCYVGSLDHVPMSYWECYWAADDEVGEHFDAVPTDQGLHLLIGPPEFLGNGLAVPLVRAMLRFQFTHAETDRVVVEPDVRNDVVRRVFRRCGFEPVREIAMDEKDAMLMLCHRETFEETIWPDGRADLGEVTAND